MGAPLLEQCASIRGIQKGLSVCHFVFVNAIRKSNKAVIFRFVSITSRVYINNIPWPKKRARGQSFLKHPVNSISLFPEIIWLLQVETTWVFYRYPNGHSDCYPERWFASLSSLPPHLPQSRYPLRNVTASFRSVVVGPITSSQNVFECFCIIGETSISIPFDANNV